MFQIHLVHIVEEVLYPLIIPIVVDNDESNLTSSYKGRHKPLIEFVDRLQIHIVGFPFVLKERMEKMILFRTFIRNVTDILTKIHK